MSSDRIDIPDIIDLAVALEWDAPASNPVQELLPPVMQEGAFRLSTSERNLYRRCRRKWMFGSPNMMARTLARGSISSPLWFGSGFHYVMEDWHGERRYGPDPLRSFYAYVRACREAIPDDVAEMCELAEGVIPAFLQWEADRGEWETVWHNGRPLVEVGWQVDISPYLSKATGSVVYTGVFDRIVRDNYGRHWILDYKTAKNLDAPKALELDPQISAYLWAANTLIPASLGIEGIEGLIYVQVKKETPRPPALLTDGRPSLNSSQKTTYALYKEAVIARFGRKRSQIPDEYWQFMGALKAQETDEGNAFFKRTLVSRTREQIQSEPKKVLAEAREMLSPFLPIYPNPTRDCQWDCSYQGACLAMDDGADWEHILDEQTGRQVERHPWRSRLPEPEEHEQWLNLKLARDPNQEQPTELEALLRPLNQGPLKLFSQ